MSAAAILVLVVQEAPAAAGLAAKGWAAARELGVEADTARLRALGPGEGIREFFALAELARQLAPASTDEGDHVGALIAVAAAFRGAGSR